MSTERDVTRIVRSWLEEGVAALPDRVLDTVLDQLPATPQRRAWWPARRFREMNMALRFAVAAAAVVAVAVVGVNLLPRQGESVGPGASPTPALTPAPTPSLLPTSGDLDPGAYYIAAGPTTPARLTFTVPAGWSTSDGFVYKGGSGSGPAAIISADLVLVSWLVSHVYADICQHEGSLVEAGSTADELAAVLLAQKGRAVSEPADVTVGGFPAHRIEMTVPSDLDVSGCDSGIIRFWPDPGPDENGGLCCTVVGSTDVVYVVDVAGTPFALVARHRADTSAAELAELDGVVSSIRLDVPASSPSPSTPSASP